MQPNSHLIASYVRIF